MGSRVELDDSSQVEPTQKVSDEWMAGFESYNRWFKSLVLRSKKDEITGPMRLTYNSNLRKFIKFFRAGGDAEVTPDSIIKWAKTQVQEDEADRVIELFNDFSFWLQGKDVEGYDKRTLTGREKFINPGSADNIAHGSVRGFITHNKVPLPRSGKKKTWRPKVKKNDENYAIFKAGKNGKEVADYSLLGQFISCLNIHDQTVMLSILATSQDPGDVLSLTVGFVTSQKNNERLYWEGERQKTDEGFRTFFSKEATMKLRRYVAQERKDAGPDDPLFVRTKGRPLTPKNLAENCNAQAKKMGLTNSKTQHPFRPKRMRSIFRSACSIAGIEKGFINVFMGHKTDVSDAYMEKPKATLELRYMMVESYLTVFGADTSQEISEMKERVLEYSGRQDKAFDLMFDIREENKRLVERVENLAERLGSLEALKDRIDELESYLTPDGPVVKDEVEALKKGAEELNVSE